jgi:hypothetical protein
MLFLQLPMYPLPGTLCVPKDRDTPTASARFRAAPGCGFRLRARLRRTRMNEAAVPHAKRGELSGLPRLRRGAPPRCLPPSPRLPPTPRLRRTSRRTSWRTSWREGPTLPGKQQMVTGAALKKSNEYSSESIFLHHIAFLEVFLDPFFCNR